MGAGELNMDHNFGVDLGSSVGVDVLLRGRWRRPILSFFPSPSVGICGSTVLMMQLLRMLSMNLNLLGRGLHIRGRC